MRKLVHAGQHAKLILAVSLLLAMVGCREEKHQDSPADKSEQAQSTTAESTPTFWFDYDNIIIADDSGRLVVYASDGSSSWVLLKDGRGGPCWIPIPMGKEPATDKDSPWFTSAPQVSATAYIRAVVDSAGHVLVFPNYDYPRTLVASSDGTPIWKTIATEKDGSTKSDEGWLSSPVLYGPDPAVQAAYDRGHEDAEHEEE